MHYASSQDMALLDDLAVRHGLQIRQMMELAAFHMVALFDILHIAKDSKVVILAGKGNNGGDGIAAARHLVNYGWKRVRIVLAESEQQLTPDAAHHLALAKKMRLPILHADVHEEDIASDITDADVIIDALLGYRLEGNPRGTYATLISHANHSHAEVISYDLPSGMNANTGGCADPSIIADATLMLALPKTCCQTRQDNTHLGDVYLADLGIPVWMYDLVSPGARPHFQSTGLLALR